LVAALRSRVPHVTLNEAGRVLRGEELCEFLGGHDAAIVALEPLTDAILQRLPELRVVSKYGVGLDSLDLEAVEAADVCLGWTPGVNRHSVAELSVAAMIVLLHRVPEAVNDVRSGQWRQWRGRELRGATVGIIGCGNVGQEVVKILAPFGCRVLAHDIHNYADFYWQHGIESVELGFLMEQSDVVTVHLPRDATTVGLLDESMLGRMRSGAVLVNMARGGIIDEQALLARLDSDTLAGAALDVLSEEPPQDRRLIEHVRTLVTPHIGGSTQEAVHAMGMAAIEGLFTAETIADWRAGGRLP